MIFSLIVLLFLIVFMAFFIGKNLTNVCTFWIFKTFTDLPVAILALVAFGAGVVVSILVFLLAKLKKSATEDRVANAKESVKKQQNKVQKQMKRLEKKDKKIGKVKAGSASDSIDNVDNSINQEEK